MKKLALSLAVVAASGAFVANQWGQDDNTALDGLMPANAETSLDGGAAPAASSEPAIAPKAAPEAAADAAAGTEPAPLDEPAIPAAPAPRPEPAAVILPAPFVIDRPAPPAPPIVAGTATAAVVAAAADAGPADAVIAPPVPLPRPRPHRVAAMAPLATPVSMTVAAGGGPYADGTFSGPSVDAYYGMVQIQAIVKGGRLTGIKVLHYPSDRRTSVAINRQALPMLRDEAVTAQSAEVDIVSGATLTSRAFIRSLRGALQQATA